MGGLCWHDATVEIPNWGGHESEVMVEDYQLAGREHRSSINSTYVEFYVSYLSHSQDTKVSWSRNWSQRRGQCMLGCVASVTL